MCLPHVQGDCSYILTPRATGAARPSPAGPECKKRFMRSPVPLLADPMPALASADQSAVPDHEAFMDISLGFKSNVMRLRNWFGKVVIEFSPSPAIDGCRLNRDEYALIVAAIETVDHYMSSKDTSDSDIREKHCLPYCETIPWAIVYRSTGLLATKRPWWRISTHSERCYIKPDGVEYLQRADGQHRRDVGGCWRSPGIPSC